MRSCCYWLLAASVFWGPAGAAADDAKPARRNSLPMRRSKTATGSSPPGIAARTASSTFASASPPRRSNAILGPTRAWRSWRRRISSSTVRGASSPTGPSSSARNSDDWMNADLGQRSVSPLLGMTDYYRYTGDPAAIGIITLDGRLPPGLLPDAGRPPLAQLHHQRPDEGQGLWPGRPARLHPVGPLRATRLGDAGRLQADGQSALPGGRQALGRPAGRALRPSAGRGAVEPPRQSRDAPKDGAKRRRPASRSFCSFSTT